MKVGKSLAEKAIHAAQPNTMMAITLPSIRTDAQLKEACRDLEAEAVRLARRPGELILVVARIP